MCDGGHENPPGGSIFKLTVGFSELGTFYRKNLSGSVRGHPFFFKIAGSGHALPEFIVLAENHQHIAGHTGGCIFTVCIA